MSGSIETILHPTVTRGRQAARRRHTTVFYFYVVVAVALTVFLGFAPSFYLRILIAPRLGIPPLPSTLVFVHGLVFTSWMLLLIAQTMLVRSGNVRVHRRLGYAGAIIAALMLGLGLVAQILQTHREVASGDFAKEAAAENALTASALIGIVVFAALVAAAILYRRRPDVHRRLIVLANLILVVAAAGRIVGVLAYLVPAFGPFARAGSMLIPDAFIIAFVVHDFVTVRRVHSATLWGSAPILVLQALTFTPLYATPFANHVTLAVSALVN